MRLDPVSWTKKTPFSAPDEKQWRNVPYVNFNRDNQQVKLNSNPDDNSNDNLSVPSFRDSPSQTPVIETGVCFYETDFDHPPSIRPIS